MARNDRRCISCRRVAPKSAFFRIVRIHPTHAVQLDQGMGRSAYLCPTVACLEAAQKRDRLSRMLKAKVPAAIYEALWQRLQAPPATAFSTQANVDSLPLANSENLDGKEARSPHTVRADALLPTDRPPKGERQDEG